MDAYEATQVVFARVQAQDPENVSKIIGYLLLQDRSEQEMARLALGSEALLQSAIANARRELGICGSPPPQFNHGDLSAAHLLNLQQQQNERIVQLDRLNRPSPLYIPDSVGYSMPSPHEQQQNPLIHDKLMAELSATSKISSLNHHNHHHHHHLHNNHHQQQQHQQQLFGSSMHHHNPLLMPTDSHPAEFQDWYFNNNNDSPTYYNSNNNNMLKPGFGYANASKRHLLSSNSASSSGSHDFPSSPSSAAAAAAAAAAAVALAWKPCLYYSRGYCKHGTNCRFLHGSLKDGSPQGSPGSSSSNGGQCSMFLEDDIPSGSLERLEMELQELLRGRRTPISIASLPQLYYEKFGKTLQAEGYLTESQRHGRVGYSLTKLLARLKGSVVLIDSRPHGQHAVVLAEDAQRFVGYRAERDDLKDANPSSRQIYLTFPAESTFTEEDVSSHFRAYGPVQDVRIPYQQKRMFGFVTFLYPETVKTILSEGNPHYICGARVLVKPYREKAKPNERKQPEKVDPLRAPQFRSLSGKDFMQDASANLYDAFARRFEEDRMLELERRRLVELHSLRARAADAEAEAERNSPLLNGIHGDSSEVPLTPQVGEHNNGINEAAMTAEEMQQFQSSNPFGFVMDVLDGEMGDEAEDGSSDSKVKVNVQQQSSNTESSKSNGHNLPDNLFASSNENSVSEDQLTYSLQEKMMGMNLNEVLTMASLPMSAPTVTQKDLICCICLEHCIEPSKLECSHTFCVQCILKVIRGSKDECPICRQHIGSQVYKILQNKDLQSWLSPTAVSHRVAQHIW